MRSSVDVPQCSPGSEGTNSSVNNNSNSNNNSNRTNNENSGNSGSQYALCALGVGLIAMGIVMVVWSMVPSDASTTNSSTSSGGSAIDTRRNKASSVAFVLAGSGVAMLLLSLCLGMRNKRREQLRTREAQNQREAAAREQQEREAAEEQARRFAVPSYEEAVESGQYPVRQSNLRPSISQLPSYDELVQVDGIQYENEGSEVTTTISQSAQSSNAPAVSTTNHRPGKNSLKLLPIKIRRIKSEKLPMKTTGTSQPAPDISIEPLTPPPQYEDKVPPL
ncbi:transmembrane protein 51a [Kryptolebias marmoratus]|uniref:Transmembrane protein 51a n=1 Tax=Kryptolebias marmoratus TaxID=37003 RepID=A0A3Q3AQT4_KRYMA|nr:transmembrane protein 51a [Kryptolebias marmoratus]XP_017273306.1 transmembrane protein 51a [Kryptolebias marmoratus]XP_037833094.1 transmembrane protein 51a [Kryptolebias marmoratus]